MLIKRLYSQPGTGPTGKIDVPAVGVLVGEMDSWDLTMREGVPPGKGVYTFRASFLHISAWMFNDPNLVKRIIIEIGRGQQYRLIPDDDARTELDGRSLLIEGVTLDRVRR